MNKLVNYLIFGIVGYKVFQNFKVEAGKLQDWDYRIKDIFFSGITANRIQGMVVWDFINKSSQAGGAKDINVNIIFENAVIGSISAPGPYQVPGNGSAEIRTAFTLDLGAIGGKTISLLTALGKTADIPLVIQGSARVRAGAGFYVKLPINLQTSAKTIYSWFA